MLRNLLISLVAAVLAQGQTGINLSASRQTVVAGSSLQISASIVSEFGSPVAADGLRWNSSNPALATVSDKGLVRGLGLGSVEIEAADAAGSSARLKLEIIPGAVEINPSFSDLRVGEQLKLQARVLDSDGKLIAGAKVRWASGVSGVVSVAQDGTVTGVGAGLASVSGFVDGDLPVAEARGTARINVAPRAAYRIRRLLNSEANSGATEVVSVSDVASCADGTFAAIATLGNGAQALYLIEANQPRLLSVTGQIIDGIARPVSRFLKVSINSKHQVAVAVEFPSEWSEAAIATFQGDRLRLSTPLYGDIRITSEALGDDGSLIYGEGAQVWEMRSGSVRRLVSNGDKLNGSPITQLDAPVRLGQESYAFLGFLGGKRTAFRIDQGKLSSLFQAGASVGGKNVTGFDYLKASLSGLIVVRGSGDGYTGVLRLDGTPSWLLMSGQTVDGFALGWVHWLLDARGDRILMNGDGRAQNLEYLSHVLVLQAGKLQSVTATQGYNSALRGALTPGGAAVVAGIGNDRFAGLRTFSGAEGTSVLAEGTPVTSDSGFGVDWLLLPDQLTSATSVLRGAGDVLVRVSGGKGSAVPVQVAGQTGALTSVGTVRGTPSGDTLFTAGTSKGVGLYAVRSGRVTLIARSNGGYTAGGGREIGWINTYRGPYLAGNSSGDIAVSGGTSAGGELFYFSSAGGQAQTLVVVGSPMPGGGTLDNISEVAVDEQGRVAFTGGVGGKASAFIWDRGTMRRGAYLGQPGPSGLLVNYIGGVRAAGDRFVIDVAYGSGNNVRGLAILTEDGPQLMATNEDSSFDSKWYSSIMGNQISGSLNGDSAFIGSSTGGQFIGTIKRSGAYKQVASIYDPGPQGESYNQFLRIASGPSGEVYFSAQITTAGQTSLAFYEATPQN